VVTIAWKRSPRLLAVLTTVVALVLVALSQSRVPSVLLPVVGVTLGLLVLRAWLRSGGALRFGDHPEGENRLDFLGSARNADWRTLQVRHAACWPFLLSLACVDPEGSGRSRWRSDRIVILRGDLADDDFRRFSVWLRAQRTSAAGDRQ
jgi:hypothetical protein